MTRKSSKTAKIAKSVKARTNPAQATPNIAQAYIRGVLDRSEAALPDLRGELPPGATHEIVGHKPDGLPELRERKKSIF